MQKVLRRSVLAKRQAARRAVNRAGQNATDSRINRQRGLTDQTAAIREGIHAARLARREDWLLGPLAPKRDSGDAKDTYGTVNQALLRSVEKPKGIYKDWGIVEGDRVVIVQDGHREMGTIGKVTEIREKSEECVIAGMNLVDIAVPDFWLAKETNKNPIRAYEAPFPLSAVRLVTPLPHPETGVQRDVIISEIQVGQRSPNKRSVRGPPTRCIAGLEPAVYIPYPKKEDEEFDDYDDDTLRIEVEQKTWVPTLLNPPMPPSIIDELRNKYSKFRDRHDASYIAKKIEEDQVNAEKRKSSKKMMTPLKELHRKERAEKRARGKPVLSEEMLGSIGEVMAKRRLKEREYQRAVI